MSESRGSEIVINSIDLFIHYHPTPPRNSGAIMAWEILPTAAQSTYLSGGEEFSTQKVKFISRNVETIPGSGYKTDDTVMTDIYVSGSQHGDFRWAVTARLEGLNGYADIEHVRCTDYPAGCEVLTSPEFEVVHEGVED